MPGPAPEASCRWFASDSAVRLPRRAVFRVGPLGKSRGAVVGRLLAAWVVLFGSVTVLATSAVRRAFSAPAPLTSSRFSAPPAAVCGVGVPYSGCWISVRPSRPGERSICAVSSVGAGGIVAGRVELVEVDEVVIGGQRTAVEIRCASPFDGSQHASVTSTSLASPRSKRMALILALDSVIRTAYPLSCVRPVRAPEEFWQQTQPRPRING